MNATLQHLLLNAQSDQREIQNNAILQLALLLEKHALADISSEEITYTTNLSPELFDLQLTLTDQKAVVEALCSLIQTDKRVPGMFWALSKGANSIISESLDKLIDSGFTTTDEMMFSQMAIAFDNCYNLPNSNKKKYITLLTSYLNSPNPEIVRIASKKLNGLDLRP